ncbi:hypothetical protein [Agrobacterium larrymoorei]|uniref:Uncharacterized protein n=1 Tax=Agrobacterium larrymoorei TaxID=160699 RepID=A0AAF0KK93_9HYPH|nr:hypothetical protein [Agrobacterium larrymoorei]WHA44054.1 hypothetical protein CFBP5477_021800 [Agrobacterium larrymoorei]
MIKVDEGKRVSWQLYKDGNDDLILSVLCGSIGTWEFKTFLSYKEQEKHTEQGSVFLDNLALVISKDPEHYKTRQIS